MAITELVKANRAFTSKIAGQSVLLAVEDAARVRDALGLPLPMGIPLAFIEPVLDPLGDLVSRYARTHGPFLTSEVAARFGLGVAIVQSALDRLGADGRVVQGEFRPIATQGGATGLEWCDAQVLRRIRQRSLAALRAEVEPVDRVAYARFLPAWQHINSSLRGHDGVLTVIDQLAGVPIPVSAVEPLVLAVRVRDYSPALLDELMASGEVLWSGAGSLPGNDGWISLHLAESAALTLSPAEDYMPGALALRVQEFLSSGGAYFFQQLRLGLSDTELPSNEALTSALWELVWAGRVGNETFAPVRGMLDGGHTAHKQKARTPRLRPGRLPGAQGAGRYAGLSRPATPMGSPMVGGRWSSFAVATEVLEPTVRAHAMADTHGPLRGSHARLGCRGGSARRIRLNVQGALPP